MWLFFLLGQCWPWCTRPGWLGPDASWPEPTSACGESGLRVQTAWVKFPATRFSTTGFSQEDLGSKRWMLALAHPRTPLPRNRTTLLHVFTNVEWDIHLSAWSQDSFLDFFPSAVQKEPWPVSWNLGSNPSNSHAWTMQLPSLGFSFYIDIYIHDGRVKCIMSNHPFLYSIIFQGPGALFHPSRSQFIFLCYVFKIHGWPGSPPPLGILSTPAITPISLWLHVNV